MKVEGGPGMWVSSQVEAPTQPHVTTLFGGRTWPYLCASTQCVPETHALCHTLLRVSGFRESGRYMSASTFRTDSLSTASLAFAQVL